MKRPHSLSPTQTRLGRPRPVLAVRAHSQREDRVLSRKQGAVV